MTTRFPSVPLADDPELAEHALWNGEIASDAEERFSAEDAFVAWARREGILDTLGGDRYCDMSAAFQAGYQAGKAAS